MLQFSFVWIEDDDAIDTVDYNVVAGINLGGNIFHSSNGRYSKSGGEYFNVRGLASGFGSYSQNQCFGHQ